MPAEHPSIKSVAFPGSQNVAGVDQGYAPLHFRHAVITVQDRRVNGGKRSQNMFTFGFKPDEEQLAQLKAGGTLYLSIWHDVIPPMRLYVGLSQEDLDSIDCVSSMEETIGYSNWSRVRGEFNVRVFLDDVEQLQCCFADRKEGKITRLKTKDGKPVIDGDNYVEEDAFGTVRLEFERIDQ